GGAPSLRILPSLQGIQGVFSVPSRPYGKNECFRVRPLVFPGDPTRSVGGILGDMVRTVLLVTGLVVAAAASAADPAAGARGKKALEETAFIPGFWPPFAYDQAWKTWG